MTTKAELHACMSERAFSLGQATGRQIIVITDKDVYFGYMRRATVERRDEWRGAPMDITFEMSVGDNDREVERNWRHMAKIFDQVHKFPKTLFDGLMSISGDSGFLGVSLLGSTFKDWWYR